MKRRLALVLSLVLLASASLFFILFFILYEWFAPATERERCAELGGEMRCVRFTCRCYEPVRLVEKPLAVSSAEPVVVDAGPPPPFLYSVASHIELEGATAETWANITVAAAKLDGLRLAPGERFSFNERVGERTADAGFKESTVLFQGVEQKGIGGGVCSVSTALYQAVMHAELEVLERHPHSRPRSYAGPGRDAAVNWPDLDLRFQNDKDDDVQIVTRVTPTGLWVDLKSESVLPQSTTSVWKPGAPTPFSTHEIESKYVKRPKLVRQGDFGAPGVTVWVAWYESADGGSRPAAPRRVRSNYKPVHEVYVVPPKTEDR